MGFFDRFRKNKESFVGWSGPLGDDFEQLVGDLQSAYVAQEFRISSMGPMTLCRSPVLVVRGGQVMQPAAVVPEPMLQRFWSASGRVMLLDGRKLTIPLVTRLAPAFVERDELAREAFADIQFIYVSDDAPLAPWPVQDRRLRLASLLLADVVRKLAARFTPQQVIASYGLSKTEEHDAAAKERYAAMSAEEQGWLQAALAAGSAS